MVTTMRGTLIPAIAVGFAVFVLAGPKPALSTPAAASLAYGETDASLLQDVAKKHRYSRNWNKRPRYRGYAYRYRSYGYWNQPYAYYDYPYYYRRPGISFWFGF
jgi:hypothetical protein